MKATDAGGLYYEKVLLIEVEDTDESPVVESLQVGQEGSSVT